MDQDFQDRIDLEQCARRCAGGERETAATDTGRREAFARLVNRHAGFVYNVARREVHDPHLADDVAQAVFLILWQRRAKVRPQFLGSWLFTTTRNVAANARKSAARRAYHERRAAAMAHECSEDAMSRTGVDEAVFRHLNDALAGQRRHDRAIVLMRHEQGLDVPRIARLLGVTEPAARKRLERAIDRLRQSLQRRGVVTSGEGACAALVAAGADAAPAHVVAGAVAASAGAAPSGAAALAQVMLTTMTWASMKAAAIALLLVAGTTAIGLQVFLAAAGAPPAASAPASAPAPVLAAAAPAQPVTQTITYTGLLATPDGAPTADARVWSELTAGRPENAKLVEAETTTDAQGRYTLGPLPALPAFERSLRDDRDGWQKRTLRFDAPGHALAWSEQYTRENVFQEPVVDQSIRLERAGEVKVRVLDPRGQPIAGAGVSISLQHMGEFLGAGRGSLFQGYGYLTLPPRPDVARSGADGIVSFLRIPETARAHITVSHPDFVKYWSHDGYSGGIHPLRADGEVFDVTMQAGGKIRVRAPRQGPPLPATPA